MTGIANKGAGAILRDIADIIVANKAYLSEIDGKIGDGDHGVNMAKGFGRAAERLIGDETLDAAMETLSEVLLTEIGGSMGPLYGTMFSDMAEKLAGVTTIDGPTLAASLRAGLDGVQDIGSAQVGDKSLMDTLVPAVEAFEREIGKGTPLPTALEAMKSAAVDGRDSTVDLVAKIGRSARLGERSRGVLDAGATSCCLILAELADGIARRLS